MKKIIGKIEKRNKEILNGDKDFNSFQEYKKNQQILNSLKKIKEERGQENVVEAEKSNGKKILIFLISFFSVFLLWYLVDLAWSFYKTSSIFNEKEKKDNIELKELKKNSSDLILKNEEKNNFNWDGEKIAGEKIKNDLEEIKDENNEVIEKKEDKKYKKKEEKIKEPKKDDRLIIVSTEMRGNRLGYFFAYKNGKLIKEGKISSGKEHYESPVGSFKVLEKKKEYTSKLYPNPDGSNNMNNMVRLTWDGIALHEGNPNQISHGCIHVAPKDAPWVFDWSKIGKTRVYITTKKIDKNKNLNRIIAEIEDWNKEEKKKREDERDEIEYWPNGNYKSSRHYKGEYLNGWQNEYWENGFIKSQKFYKNGRWDEHRIDYWDNGQVMRDFIWKNDQLKMGKTWSKDGKLLSSFDIRRDDEK